MRFPIARTYGATFLFAAALTACSGGSPSSMPRAVQGTDAATMAAQRGAPGIPQLVQYDVLHTFSGYPSDGQYPDTNLLNDNGTFYGTSSGGGGTNGGTVFSMTPAGVVTVLHSFGSETGPDGSDPEGALINVGGTLYGTTFYGGANGIGCVYSIVIATGAEKVVYSFQGGSDSELPQGGLVNIGGVLYGTSLGGSDENGTVYSVTRKGVETVLHTFTGEGDGGSPQAGLLNVGGTLYGTTSNGGANGTGTVFSITTGGTKNVVYNFGSISSGDANEPYAPLADVSGTLYGTTINGGKHNLGTVFSVTTGGAESIVYSFAGGVADGANPYSGLLALNGNLFGTTSKGGSTGTGDGIVFKLTTAGKETVLHVFTGQPSDGAYSVAGLVKYKTLLYGTTRIGGTLNYGTAFSISP